MGMETSEHGFNRLIVVVPRGQQARLSIKHSIQHPRISRWSMSSIDVLSISYPALQDTINMVLTNNLFSAVRRSALES